jgi:PII-like signaling protein
MTGARCGRPEVIVKSVRHTTIFLDEVDVKLQEDGRLLRIFISENDKHAGVPLSNWIVRQARDHQLSGATVLRGLEGFGAHGHLHTAKFQRSATDHPIVVEIVDSRERIEAFLPIIDAVISEGLITLEKVEVRTYRSEG